ncbi:MAG: tRNA (adenosine(37)-N6)-dimethylallyltransferase MiaA [Pseudomonadota bacterium]
MGPTGTGKTVLAVDLARALDGEVISVDSALVYRGMDIGTAKPDAGERGGVPHHLIDILDPAEAYSAAAFRRDALALIEAIRQRGRLPILAGGTMLYFRALIDGIAEMPETPRELQAELEAEWQSHGAEALHGELQRVDPASAARIHINDPQRLLRALAVYRVSGRSLSDWHGQPSASGYGGPMVKLGLLPADRPRHRALVAKRFEAMMAAGFEDEVRALYRRPDLSADMPAMRCVGYRQLWRYLDGEWDLETAVEKAVTATRQLAKRQMTWLRKEPDLQALDPFELQPESVVNGLRERLSWRK